MSTNLKFITGLSGEAHVKPAMDAQWHSAINGAETFVYDYGQKFALTVNQAMSTMSIASGVGQIQGRLFIIEESLIETISYPNVPPEVGLTRIDTVLLHWGTSTRIINGETVTVNTCEFEYKKNPLANGQPEAFAETDLNLGDTDAYYPMWHVTWNENGIQEVDAIFTVVDKATVGIDTTAPSGTVDGDLYSALVALGWENDVIDELLNVKKLLTKVAEGMKTTTLWESATKVNNGTITIADWADYDYLILCYKTNVDYMTTVIPKYESDNALGHLTSAFAFSGATPTYYSSSSWIRTSATQFSFSEKYNNSNWVLGLYRVLGVKSGGGN